ncbi:MAG: hypothetical protein HRU38_02745 [Saccharospirillaceae bacterium]|nr:hypothetical protein [Pseudomonadales bacterium]NRB77580.1 hypothetical protein [Saccharospirillaceae bacterium]
MSSLKIKIINNCIATNIRDYYSKLITEEHHLDDVCLSLLFLVLYCIVSKNGVIMSSYIQLADLDKQQLKGSVKILKE